MVSASLNPRYHVGTTDQRRSELGSAVGQQGVIARDQASVIVRSGRKNSPNWGGEDTGHTAGQTFSSPIDTLVEPLDLESGTTAATDGSDPPAEIGQALAEERNDSSAVSLEIELAVVDTFEHVQV